MEKIKLISVYHVINTTRINSIGELYFDQNEPPYSEGIIKIYYHGYLCCDLSSCARLVLNVQAGATI